jgi:branched-chain amino acid transport system permease protein
MGVYPGADFEVMLLGFVVVIVGGLGSLKGALVGGLIVGLLDNFGKVFFPEFALFTIFAPMALILAVRPLGLFGRE